MQPSDSAAVDALITGFEGSMTTQFLVDTYAAITQGTEDRTLGVVVECEGGSVSLYRGIAWDKDGTEVKRFSGGGDHFANFIAAVRKADPKMLNAEVAEGHVSTAVCHTGNISYRVGEKASRKQIQARLQEAPLFLPVFDRFMEHLAAHGIDVDAPTATLGPWLTIDAQNEQFRGNEQANR
jgi:hypothetical protein